MTAALSIDHQTPLTANLAGPFTVHMANLTGGDIQFLSDLTALFCDPQYADKLEGLRAGKMGIYRDPQTHKCLISDLFTPPIVLAKQNSRN